MNFLEYYQINEAITPEMEEMIFNIKIDVPMKKTGTKELWKAMLPFSLDKFKLNFQWKQTPPSPICSAPFAIKIEKNQPINQLNKLKSDIDFIEKNIKNNLKQDKNCGTIIQIGMENKDDIKSVYLLWTKNIQEFAKLFISPKRHEKSKQETAIGFKRIPENIISIYNDKYNLYYSNGMMNFSAKEATLDSNEIIKLIDLVANIVHNHKKLKEFFEDKTGEKLNYKKLLDILNQNPEEIKDLLRKQTKKNIKIRKEMKEEIDKVKDIIEFINIMKNLEIREDIVSKNKSFDLSGTKIEKDTNYTLYVQNIKNGNLYKITYLIHSDQLMISGPKTSIRDEYKNYESQIKKIS